MELHPATLWEAISDAVPARTAQVQGVVRWTWRDFDDRASRLAGALAANGVRAGSKVGQLLYNCPEPWLPDLLICRPELRDAVLAVTRAQPN